MPTIEDLGKALKLQYPDKGYDTMSDADLGSAWKIKYPGKYDSFSGGDKGYSAGDPRRGLEMPGVGLAKAGLGSLATTMSLGGMSPDPKSVAQAASEGTAAIAMQFGGGLGVNLAEKLGMPLVERLLVSGWGGKMAAFIAKPLARITGAYTGGITGSLAASGTQAAFQAATGKDVGAPQSLSEAVGRAGEAGKFQGTLQTVAEGTIPVLSKGVGLLTARAERGAVASEMNLKAKKLEKLQAERTDYLKAQNIREIKEAQAESINKVSDDVVRDIGQSTTPEQMADKRNTIKTRVVAKLNTQMEAGFKELDAVAAEHPVITSNLKPAADIAIAIEKAEPRGIGIAKPVTEPSSRYMELVNAARGGQPFTIEKTVVKTPGVPPIREPITGQVMKPGTDPVLETLRLLQPGNNEAVPLGAALKGRGTISREIANPATDEETRNLMTKILKPWDQAIESGLAKIDPSLAVKFGAAKDVWHKNSVIMDQVIAKRFATGGPRSLLSEIQPNAPRNVEQVRLAMNQAFPPQEAEMAMNQIRRAKTEELMMNSKGEPDLAGYRARYEDYGNTMRNLHNTPDARATQDKLLAFSDEFAHMRNNPSIKNDQKLAALDAAIATIEAGGERKKVLETLTGFFMKPHIAMYGAAGMAASAGISGAHAYGPIGLAGGVASIMVGRAAEQRLIPALVKVAENKPNASKLLVAMKSWRENPANPRDASNLARALIAGYEASKTQENINAAQVR